MFRLVLSALVIASLFACTPKRVAAEASSTIEDVPNEPVAVADAGVAPAAEAVKEEAPPPPPVTLVRSEAPEGFAVLMPQNPQVQRGEVPLKKGKVVTVSMSSNIDGVIYNIARYEYPEAAVKKAGVAKMLAEARAGLAAQLKGTVADEKDLEFAGSPGQSFNIAGPTSMGRARSALIGNSLYTLIVVYAGNVPVKADEFLGSLQVAGPAPSRPAPAPAPSAGK